ncbi:hypothetical protein [Priestia taiwanensis]|uniref:Uncharacterized protein n=1 Tax=Priestia taiwanensis TaxID=1347902 RepID=A0A917AR62_9BACI|nr:hypothetical protein [Priestia taiwanensis]MBM7363164.1 hypothetical protein [Priestia taiwanensis]GGE68220.1 hypothetical protein GCM10007140_17840 [Priestia taiwanensis]
MNKWKVMFLMSLFIAIGCGIYSFAQYGTILCKEYVLLFLSVIFLFWGLAEWKDKEKEMAYIYFCTSIVNAMYSLINIIV